MRFFVTGEQNRQLLINTLILMFLGYVVLLWLSNGLMFFHKMNLSPESVIAYYLGSEQDFTQPRSYQSLLEVSHFHLFAMGMLILTLTHLMIMTSLPTLLKVWLSVVIYGSALADEAAGLVGLGSEGVVFHAEEGPNHGSRLLSACSRWDSGVGCGNCRPCVPDGSGTGRRRGRRRDRRRRGRPAGSAP